MAQAVSFGARKSSGGGGGKIVVVLLIVAVGLGFVYRQKLSAMFTPAPPPAAPRKALEKKPDEVWEFVTTDKIPAYTTAITPNMVRKIPIKASLVEGKDILTSESDVYSRVPIQELEANRELREKYFAKKGTQPGLAAGVPPGWVARTFDFTEVEGQLDDLRVNNLVALLSASKDRPSEIVSESARVLVPMKKTITKEPPTKGNPSPKKKTEGSLTICYPAQDSLAVAEAVARGKIQILLMSSAPGADKQYDFHKVVIQGAGPAGTQSSVSSNLDVETIRGTKRAWEKVNYATDSQ